MLKQRLTGVKDFDYHADELLVFATDSLADVCTFFDARFRAADKARDGDLAGRIVGLVPHGIQECVCRHMRDSASVSAFVDWLVAHERSRNSFAQYAVQEFAQEVFGATQRDGRDLLPHLRKHIADKLADGATEAAIDACKYLPIQECDADMLLAVMTAAEKDQMLEYLEDLLRHLAEPIGFWGAEEKDGPKGRRDVLGIVAARVPPGLLHSLLQDRIRASDQMRKWFEKHEEDLLNPR
jgi:hypothetical protein